MATKKAARKPKPTTTAAPATTGGNSIWERVEQAQAPRTLDYDRIAAAAVEIADQDGLDAVSMRRLASELGVATMALYRYVRSKEDLLWLMTDVVVRDVEVPDAPDAGWRDIARASATQTRAVIRAHPWLVAAGSRLPVGLTPARMAIVERLLRSLDAAGLDARTAYAAMTTLTSFVWGFAGGEVTQETLMRRHGWTNLGDLRNAYDSELRWLMDSGRYPHFGRWAKTAAGRDDPDRRFALGLDCVVEGIATHLGI